jgi:hypothetical protein
MKLKIPIFSFLILLGHFSFGQIKSTIDRSKIDSLLLCLDESVKNERVVILNQLSASLAPLRFDSSYSYAQEALELSKESGTEFQTALALFNTGNSFYFNNDLKNALINYQDALLIMEKNQPGEDVGNLLLQLGFIHYFSGSSETAIDYYKNAVQVFDKTENFDAKMYSYRMLGIIYWGFNRCDSALFYDTIWLNYYQKENNLSEYAKGLSEVSEDLRCLKDPLAEEYGLTALKLARQLNDSFILGLYNFNLFLLYSDSSQILYSPEKAESFLTAAIEEIKKADRHSFTADFHVNAAEYYIKKNRINLAKKYLNDALVAIDSFYIQLPVKLYNEPSAKIRFQVDVKKYLVSVYNSFLTIYKKEGNFELALKYQELKDQAEDSVYADFVKNQFEFLDAKADNERKGNQILLLSQKSELQESKIRQSRYLLFGLIILFLLSAFIVYLFVRQSRLKTEQDKILLKQKLFSSQMNPHFIFNSLASIQNFIVTHDDTQASIYLSRFSELIRSILHHSRRELINLEEEINTIKNYINLQKVRFPNEFDHQLEVDDKLDIESVYLPPMLIQPFIENAIEHGFKHKTSKGQLFVRFKSQKNRLIIEIEDDGVGREKAKELLKQQYPNHTSLASKITSQRIKTLNKKTKKKIQFEIIDIKDTTRTGTKVIFEIPLNVMI